MKKLLQLVFGDLPNVASVAVALLLAWALARIAPGASGLTLTALLIAAAAIRAF